jgi:hypothetical protein
LTAAGWLVGWGLIFVRAGVQALPGNAGLLFTLATIGALVGAAIGFGQWLALRSRIVGAGQWVVASTVGWAIFGLLLIVQLLVVYAPRPPGQTASLDVLIIPIWTGIITGALVGVLQWLVLRRQVPGAALWILASALSWGLGWTTLIAAAYFGEPLGIRGNLSITAVSGIVAGALQATFMMWLLRQRPVQA